MLLRSGSIEADYFEHMNDVCGIEPRMGHFGCFNRSVDGRDHDRVIAVVCQAKYTRFGITGICHLFTH